MFCNNNCSKRRWHSSVECELLQNTVKTTGQQKTSNVLRSNYVSSWLVVLRCLLLRSQVPGDWSKLQLLEDNLENDSYKKNYVDHYLETVLKPLKSLFPELTSDIKDDEILHICARLDSNAFRQGESCRVLFSVSSMLNHSCIPNARVVFGEQGNVKVLSKSNIEAGEEITITYCSQLLGTWVRYLEYC